MVLVGDIGQRMDLQVRQGIELGPIMLSLVDEAGTPISLVGATFEAYCALPGSSTKVDMDVAIIGVDVSVSMTAVATAVLTAPTSVASPPKVYNYQINVTFAGQEKQCLTYGQLNVHAKAVQ